MYTAGTWVVKKGREDEFARRWQASVDQAVLEFPDLTFRLLQSSEEPRHFLSLDGPWRNAEQIEAARALPSFEAGMAGIAKLIHSLSVERYDLVAEVS